LCVCLLRRLRLFLTTDFVHIIKKIKKLMPCGGYVTNHGERVSLATYVTSPNKLEDVDFNHGRIPFSLNEL
ncbi:hypothetical protein KFV88_25065, partial [Klebsiella pneumoniae]|uniref:hypothetical protein n=1 Tax=Klebsiella pneumoniae TaxID=573 RepID=UPI001B8C65AF